MARNEVNLEPVDCSSREMVTQRLLTFCEHTHAIATGDGKNLMHMRPIVQREQNQGRIERNRYESIGRHTVCTIFVLGGDYAHTRGESSQGIAKLARME